MWKFIPFLSGMAMAVAAVSAQAQLQRPVPDPGEPAAQVPATAYRSPLSGYRPFTETGVAPWRDTNDSVGRIGGWKAYAREMSGEGQDAPPPAGSAATRAPAAAAHRHHGESP